MPVTPTYPGVYVEEISSGVRTIVGVATSITAFVGRTLRGPTDKSITINNFGDFERIFGGLWVGSSLGYAVRDFYLNGGSQAIIVRLYQPEFDEDNREDVEGAANEVANVAKAQTTSTAAKAKALEKSTAIQNETGRSRDEKNAAAAVATGLQALANDADAEAIAEAADSAVRKATPYENAKLEIGDLTLEAAYSGKWGQNLRGRVNLDNIPETAPNVFNLIIQDMPGGTTERFLNLSVEENSPRRVDKVLESQSRLVRWDREWVPEDAPDLAAVREAIDALKAAQDAEEPNEEDIKEKQDALWPLTQDSITQAESKYIRAKKALETKQNNSEDTETAEGDLETAKSDLETALSEASDAVSDGLILSVNTFLPPSGETEKKGMHALERADLFNLLCIPPYKESTQSLDVDVNLISAAAAYCEKRRAMLLVDPPKDWIDKSTAKEKFTDASVDHVGTRSRNAALFYPRLMQPNPLRDNQMEEFVPCGAVAGIFARTDTQRGVWKAPAGLDATLIGVPQLSVNLTDDENGELNPLGINCLRAFPIVGRVVWGSRTLRGADQLADEWKYIPVRRTALFIEESLYRGTQWVVFEPNDEPLWAQIRLNVGAFMNNLFRQGAFQGTTPREAYFVKCDKETTTQNDINLGIVNIVVGFAPLKPAEFVIIKLQQMAGQIQT